MEGEKKAQNRDQGPYNAIYCGQGPLDRFILQIKGASYFHSAGQSKEGYVGFGTSEHPIFMKLSVTFLFRSQAGSTNPFQW